MSNVEIIFTLILGYLFAQVFIGLGYLWLLWKLRPEINNHIAATKRLIEVTNLVTKTLNKEKP